MSQSKYLKVYPAHFIWLLFKTGWPCLNFFRNEDLFDSLAVKRRLFALTALKKSVPDIILFILGSLKRSSVATVYGLSFFILLQHSLEKAFRKIDFLLKKVPLGLDLTYLLLKTCLLLMTSHYRHNFLVNVIVCRFKQSISFVALMTIVFYFVFDCYCIRVQLPEKLLYFPFH